MSDEPKKLWDWFKWSWLVLVLTYFCGYFVLAQNWVGINGSSHVYSSKSVAFAYQPLGWLEAHATRRGVYLFFPHPTKPGQWHYYFEPGRER